MSGTETPMTAEGASSPQYTTLSLYDPEVKPPYKLQFYSVSLVGKARIISWQAEDDTVIHHYVPTGVAGIPYTNHSTRGQKNVVAFRQWSGRPSANIHHKFLIGGRDSGTPRLHHGIYHFISETERDEFQTRVRSRNLLKTYETDSISIHRCYFIGPSAPQAIKVTIKIWRRTETTITFFATLNVDHQTHFEFSLAWFDKQAELRGNNVLLKFNHQGDVNQRHVAPLSEHKKRTLSGSLGFGGKKPKVDRQPTRKMSLADSTPLSIHDCELRTDESIASNWDLLDICFTRAGDAEKFIKTCWDSHSQGILPLNNKTCFVEPFTKARLRPPAHESKILPTSLADKKILDSSDAKELGGLSTAIRRRPVASGPPKTMNPDPQELPYNEHTQLQRQLQAASQQWWQDFIDNRDLIFPFASDNYKPVRIAILDTGIDTTNPWIANHWKNKKLYRDFLLDEEVASSLRIDTDIYSLEYVRDEVMNRMSKRKDQPEDIAGHGTHLAGIVLQLAPHASLCVGRVLASKDETYDNSKDAKRIALAILYAVQVWKVKVINLSVGFVTREILRDSPDAARILLAALSHARHSNVTVFAAASNKAHREKLAFPACKPDHVLGINSTNGCGGRSLFNPQHHEHHENLSIMGEYIKSTWLQNDARNPKTFKKGGSVWIRAEGTSQATAIASCVAVLILQFGRQYGLGQGSGRAIEVLETFEGMRAVLRRMPERKTDSGFYDMVPWMTVFSYHPDGIENIKRNIRYILDNADLY